MLPFRRLACAFSLLVLPRGGLTRERSRRLDSLYRRFTVTAQKEPPIRRHSGERNRRARTTRSKTPASAVVSDAARLRPNTFFNEFTARKLSNAPLPPASVRAGQPGVTSYIDGVPQLNANSRASN